MRGKGTQVSKHGALFRVYAGQPAQWHALYVGVTNDLGRRVGEHKEKAVPGFTKRYSVNILVWYEIYGDVNDAIAREKQIKGWNRAWKIRLIEKDNSGWNDLTARVI